MGPPPVSIITGFSQYSWLKRKPRLPTLTADALCSGSRATHTVCKGSAPRQEVRPVGQITCRPKYFSRLGKPSLGARVKVSRYSPGAR